MKNDSEEKILLTNDYNFEKVLGKKRLVRTDPENGMLYRHMKDAMSIMGQWIEK